jgi:hypothetical protein
LLKASTEFNDTALDSTVYVRDTDMDFTAFLPGKPLDKTSNKVLVAPALTLKNQPIEHWF